MRLAQKFIAHKTQYNWKQNDGDDDEDDAFAWSFGTRVLLWNQCSSATSNVFQFKLHQFPSARACYERSTFSNIFKTNSEQFKIFPSARNEIRTITINTNAQKVIADTFVAKCAERERVYFSKF